MRPRRSLAVALVLSVALPLGAPAQVPRDTLRPPVEFGDRGVVFNAPDGVSSVAVRFRVQEWAVFTSRDDDDLHVDRTQIAVRRARIRLESVVWDPRLTVNIQLSFSRGDQDFEHSNFPNVLRDAYVTWQASPQLAFVVGQGKLPGNRQRVISSGEQQFADRSIVNGAFTIDRDVGLFANLHLGGDRRPLFLRAAITGGEGRNAPVGDDGLAYTARAELQPLGGFIGGGDYFEGDLRREPEGRLAIGATVSRNDRATRTGGQLGRPLFAPRGMTTAMIDALWKRRGLSVSAEYARRHSRDPITRSGAETRYVLSGEGLNAQVGYLLRSNLEPAIRYSILTPHRDLSGLSGADRQRQLSLGLTRYLKGHRVKLQGEVMHDDFLNTRTGVTRANWTARSSLEVGT